MNHAKVVVPIVIAVLVLHLFGVLPPQSSGPTTNDAPTKKSEPTEDDWFPLAAGNVWRYQTRGVFERGKSEETRPFERTILRKRADGRYQVNDTIGGRVVDTYFIARTLAGVEITSMSLDKRRVVFLPLSFGPGSIWNLTSTVRATADEEMEELEVAGRGIRPCLRVRYERFYDDKLTNRPDWYFEGYRWFCKGLGIVKVDLRDVQQPRLNGRVDLKETWEVRTLQEATVNPTR